MWTRTVLLFVFLAVVVPLALLPWHAPRRGVGAAGSAAVSRIVVALVAAVLAVVGCAGGKPMLQRRAFTDTRNLPGWNAAVDA